MGREGGIWFILITSRRASVLSLAGPPGRVLTTNTRRTGAGMAGPAALISPRTARVGYDRELVAVKSSAPGQFQCFRWRPPGRISVNPSPAPECARFRQAPALSSYCVALRRHGFS